VVTDQGADQDVLARGVELLANLVVALQPFLFGRLQEDLTGDQFVAHGHPQFG
jgi:hypothetical protein